MPLRTLRSEPAVATFAVVGVFPGERRLAALAMIALVPVGCARDPELPEPGSFELHPALEMRLYAAEPDVVDPVALTFDAAERMYVVEMRDYPEGLPPDGRPGGSIRLLEDTDRDGRADRSTVFAEGLRFPTSIAAWRGGVFVTAPPQILYLEDTDGDGRADLREVVFDGFTLGVTDSNVNGLRWAIDNQLHGVNGGNGGHVREAGPDGRAADDSGGGRAAADADGLPIDRRGAGDGERWTALRGLDFRFDPRSRSFETTYHTAGGFGLVFDEWGRSFSPHNVDHLQQRVIPARHLARAPALPPLRATVNVSVHGAMARIFPISTPATRPNHPEQAGHYSAAGGMGNLDFEGDDLPRGILICDVVGNLVSREVPRLEGPVLATERAAEERDREFLASRDPSFRPIGVEMGPDGALYVLDMQRDVIEHPDYIPEAMRRTLDLRAGGDRGRIYRIVPRRGLPARQTPLAEASAEELVGALAGPSRWRRDSAQRLLVERGAAPIAALRALASGARASALRASARPGEATPRRETATTGTRPADSTMESAGAAGEGDGATGGAALGRLHALWTLHGLGALGEAEVVAGLGDPHAGVRENALQIAERVLPGSAELRDRIVAMAGDPAPRVRFQAALTMGAFPHAQRTAALVRILLRDADHRFSRIAVASALGDGAVEALDRVLATGEEALGASSDTQGIGTSTRELADLVGAGMGKGDERVLERLLRRALQPSLPQERRAALLAGLEAGLARAAVAPGATPAAAAMLDRLMNEEAAPTARAAWGVRRAVGLRDGPVQARVLAAARAAARDRSLPSADRRAAVDLLGLGPWPDVADDLLDLLAGGEMSDLQAAVVAALAGFDEPELGRALVDRYRGLGAAPRREALRLLLRRPAFHGEIVAALEEGRLALGELALDLEQRRRLLRSESPGVAARAAAVVDDHEYGNRAAVVEEWFARLPAGGSAARGRAVFERLCAQCHVADGVGHAVGPDLAGLAHRSAEDLVSNILDPNLAIHPSYAAFEVTLASGASETGIVAAESPTAVTLLQAGGTRRDIARHDIAWMRSTAVSLMPPGLEQGLAPQDLRDLVELIQGRPSPAASR